MLSLQSLSLYVQNNLIKNYTSLTNLYQLAYIKDIILDISFYQALDNYTFVQNYNNAPALEYFQTLIG